MLFFVRKEQEEQISQWDHIEAIAFHQIELRKDIFRLVKALKSGKQKNKLLNEMQKKMKEYDLEITEFRKTKPYVKFTKRALDERGNHKENV